MKKNRLWWGRGVYFFLCFSIILLGVGGFELYPRLGVSAWSVSRTTFFFWLIWKLIIWLDKHETAVPFAKRLFPVTLVAFFLLVTASLLPFFSNAGDYPYFLFACAHAVMLLDVFADLQRTRLLYLGLGLLPIVIVVRGLIDDPSVFNLSLRWRFDYPLDHANTAGYLFAMSIPLAVSIALAEKKVLRVVGLASGLVQTLALLLTYSRGAWLGCAASMLFMTFALKKWKAGVLILLLPVVLLLALTPLRERFASIAYPRADDAIYDRLRVVTGAVHVGAENPILGVGYGRGRLKQALRQTYKGTAHEEDPIWHAHNVYAELFAGTGLLGLGAFIVLLGHGFLTAWRCSRSENGEDRLYGVGLAAAWIAAAVTGLGDVPFYHHSTRIFLLSLFALILLQGRQHDRRAA